MPRPPPNIQGSGQIYPWQTRNTLKRYIHYTTITDYKHGDDNVRLTQKALMYRGELSSALLTSREGKMQRPRVKWSAVTIQHKGGSSYTCQRDAQTQRALVWVAAWHRWYNAERRCWVLTRVWMPDMEALFRPSTPGRLEMTTTISAALDGFLTCSIRACRLVPETEEGKNMRFIKANNKHCL